MKNITKTFVIIFFFVAINSASCNTSTVSTISTVLPTPQMYTISGMVHAQSRRAEINQQDFLPDRASLAIENHPVQFATIIVTQLPNHKFIASTSTDENGNFSVETRANTNELFSFFVLAESKISPFNLSVEDCPFNNCMLRPNIYAFEIAQIIPGNQQLSPLIIPIESEAAGAFNILRVLQQATTYVYDQLQIAPEPLHAQWRAHQNTLCNTSCYAGNGMLYLLGLDDDSDEFDDDILRHEFGHFVEESYFHSSGPGGFHDGSPTDPNLGWSEGFCTSFSILSSQDPLYLDTNAQGGGWYNYAETNALGDPNGPIDQAISEDLIAESIWQLNAAGIPVFSRFFSHLNSPNRENRGENGIDFIDAIDALSSPQEMDLVRSIVVENHRFPYEQNTQNNNSLQNAQERSTHQSPITPTRLRFETLSQQEDITSIQLFFTARSLLTNAEISLILPDHAIQIDSQNRYTFGQLGPDQVVPITFHVRNLRPSDQITARLSSTVTGGSAYYMSSSYYPLNENTPHSYQPDNSTIITLTQRSFLRAYSPTDPN